MNEELCYLELKEGWMYVTMPDGKKIPSQRSIEVKQSMDERGYAIVNVELIVEVKQ